MNPEGCRAFGLEVLGSGLRAFDLGVWLVVGSTQPPQALAGLSHNHNHDPYHPNDRTVY